MSVQYQLNYKLDLKTTKLYSLFTAKKIRSNWATYSPRGGGEGEGGGGGGGGGAISTIELRLTWTSEKKLHISIL